MTFHRSICAIVSQKLIVEHRYLLASPRISIGNSGHSSGARARHFIRDCSNDKFSSSYGGDINFVVRHPMSTSYFIQPRRTISTLFFLPRDSSVNSISFYETAAICNYALINQY